MSLFEQISSVARPKQELQPLKLYAFTKDSVPQNREDLERAEIETVLATSFEEVFVKRPDLMKWNLVSITS